MNPHSSIAVAGALPLTIPAGRGLRRYAPPKRRCCRAPRLQGASVRDMRPLCGEDQRLGLQVS
ncbi:hypothetical protein, partial [Xanthomonas fragariae]|uniref:hypothetical protein n=1 Tax=Xanthomonas fragariae TaxID=48664 RepID=UPI001F16465D